MNEQFKEELFKVAANRALQRSTILNYAMANVIRETISQGVDRMTSKDLDNPERRKEAQQNLVILIDEVFKRSLNEGFETRTFSNARNSICPLWPFC